MRRPWTTYDPWGSFNRFIYRFNARFDEAIFLPVANDYRRAAVADSRRRAQFLRQSRAKSTASSITRCRGGSGRGVRSLGRFVINSTLGIGGLFDVAAKLNLPQAPTGFGTTLAKWGMHPGPYLVIPFLDHRRCARASGWPATTAPRMRSTSPDLYRGD